VIASYVSLRDEPGTVELNRELLARESRLLLPRLRMDGGLELVAWAGGPLRAGPRGTRVPDGPGVDPGEAELVIVPALAVDPATGVRLGRGGGAYDRLLAGLPSDRPVLALLAQPGELRPGLPAEPHDRRVTAVALPDGVLACGATG
jgi:5-formyltetrahydrofolate cyclo-ligase